MFAFIKDYETFKVTGIFSGGGMRQGFSVALEAVLKLSLVDQAVLTEIHRPLPPDRWD